MPPNLVAARATAEALFDATGTLRRPGAGEGTRDEATGTTTPPASTVVYAGPCLLRPPTTVTRDQPRPEAGAEVYTEDMRVRLPVSVTGARLGDEFTVDTSPNDPSLVGRRYQVVRVIGGSYAVTRILAMAELTRGPRL